MLFGALLTVDDMSQTLFWPLLTEGFGVWALFASLLGAPDQSLVLVEALLIALGLV